MVVVVIEVEEEIRGGAGGGEGAVLNLTAHEFLKFVLNMAQVLLFG